MTTAEQTMCTQEYDPITDEDLDDPTGGEEAPEGFEPEEAATALETLTPTLLTIPPDDLRPFPVRAAPATGLGLAYAEAYAEDRDRFDQVLKPEEFDLAEYDDLAERAMALWQADIQMRQEIDKESPFKSLLAEGKPLRRKLLKSAEFVWGEHPELGEVVTAIRKGQGHQDMADDLGALHELFTDHWDDAHNRCPVTLDDLSRAKVVGAQMLKALSPTRTAELDKARDLRQRAAEHLRRGLEEVRYAAQYVFRHDGASRERYPSLYVLRRKPRSAETGSEATSESDSAPVDPAESADVSASGTGDPAEEVTETYIPTL